MALLVLCVLGFPARTSAQPPTRRFQEGTNAFRHILHQKKLQPIRDELTFDLVLSGAGQCAPSQTLLIVLGDTSILDGLLRGRLRTYIAEGGAALIATDRLTGRELERAFGIGVSGTFVTVPPTSSSAYRGSAECPFVKVLARWHPSLMFQALDRIATNRPSYLVLTDQPRLLPLAGYPEDSEPANVPDMSKRPVVRFMPPLFAVGGQLTAGRVLVLADHSVFINDMMLKTDNDNVAFATLCIDWLTESGKRDRVLFVEEGTVQTSFEVPLKELPPPPLPSLEQIEEAAEQILLEMEEQDALHRILYDNVSGEGVLRSLLLMLSVGLLAYGMVRLLRGRHRIEPHAPLLETSLARLAPETPLVDQRHRALLRDGNLWEPAREFARHCLAAVAAPATTGAPPALTVHGGWWRRWALRRRVLQLWQLAYDNRPRRISPQEFGRLVGQINRLKQAWAEGSWRFAEGSS
jgi:hypothetical protein